MHLYLHIPFCRQACHYCDFHFSTTLREKGTLVGAMAREIAMRQDYLPPRELQTVYLGGGTPSLLSEGELALLLDTIHTYFKLKPDAEITLEANPDDLSAGVIRRLASQGINRLSMGIQSFHDPHLKFMNRAHTAGEAERSIKAAQDAGITDLTADLIYAIPHPNDDVLRHDLQKMLSMGIGHISAYCLTIEPQTAFGKWVKTKKIQPIDEEYAARQFELLMGTLRDAGYEQYEISNFARNQRYSLHNSAYWQRRPYLGIGPSAHSYNGLSRQYNVANNTAYVKGIGKNELPATKEILTAEDQVNEYLLTGLRTKWGCRLELLQELSEGRFLALMDEEIFRLCELGWLHSPEGLLLLTERGKLFADRVAGSLFLESEEEQSTKGGRSRVN